MASMATGVKSLRDLRTSKGMTLEEVGSALGGLDPSTVSLMENGKRKLSLERAEQLAKLYGISLRMVLDLSKKTG